MQQGPKQLLEQGYKRYGEVFTVPVLNKKITFLIGTEVTPFFFKATDEEMSQQEVRLTVQHQKTFHVLNDNHAQALHACL